MMSEMTIRELARSAYEEIALLRNEFDDNKSHAIYATLCEIQKPALSEHISGEGGSANVPGSFSTDIDDTDRMSRLQVTISKLKQIHLALSDANMHNEARIYQQDAQKLEQTVENSK